MMYRGVYDAVQSAQLRAEPPAEAGRAHGQAPIGKASLGWRSLARIACIRHGSARIYEFEYMYELRRFSVVTVWRKEPRRSARLVRCRVGREPPCLVPASRHCTLLPVRPVQL